MSDFFGGLNGIRKPEVVMDSGPLPPLNTSGLPYGLNGTTDARINYNSTLLGDLQPYAYGEPSRLSTQSSYLNIPHRIQKIVPLLYLPPLDMNSTHLIEVSHAVDYGDIAFSIRLRNVSSTLNLHHKSVEGSNDNGTNITAFVNLATLNYILLGFQSVVYAYYQNQVPANAMLWMRLYCDITGKQYGSVDDWMQDFNALQAWPAIAGNNELKTITAVIHTLFHNIVPFGNAIGSEKQGGQHEATFGPVMMPVNFVMTMVVDGLSRDMINFWRHMDVNSGDRLCLRLMPHNINHGHVCALNHYYKRIVTAEYNHPNYNRSYMLITPDAYPYRLNWNTFGNFPLIGRADAEKVYTNIFPRWHIGMSQQHYPQSHKPGEMKHFLDDRIFQGVGGLLQMTFSPVIRHNLRTHGDISRTFHKQFKMINASKGIGETGLKRFEVEKDEEKAKVAGQGGFSGDLANKRKISFFDMINSMDTGATYGTMQQSSPEAVSSVLNNPSLPSRIDAINELKQEMISTGPSAAEAPAISSSKNDALKDSSKNNKYKSMKPVAKKTSQNTTKANVVGGEDVVDAESI